MKALVVDDSALSRRMVRGCLESLGHSITEASDGTSALERYTLDRPDFVVLDLVMPGISGFDTLALLRKIDPVAKVIKCTADLQVLSRDRVKEMGAAGLINKPIDVDKLSVKLNSIFSDSDAWS
jgi:two-component system chemotaxis response regulator CheY